MSASTTRMCTICSDIYPRAIDVAPPPESCFSGQTPTGSNLYFQHDMEQFLPVPGPRTLGAGGLVVSPLAWGMWRLTAAGRTAAELSTLIHRILDAGITLLDTADIYGWNGSSGFGEAERQLGDVLAANPGLRNRLVLSTKGGIRPGVPYDQSPGHLARAIDDSLRRLRVETLDLWQVHRPDVLTHPQELAKALDDAVSAGKIRAMGVSNFSTAQIAALQHHLGNRLAVTQAEISPLHLDCLVNGELDQAMQLGMAVLAWSPMAGGRLANPDSERDARVAQALDAVAEQAGASRSAVACSWLMAHPAGIIPIVGSQQIERIVDALNALQVRWTRQSWYAVYVAARGRPLP